MSQNATSSKLIAKFVAFTVMSILVALIASGFGFVAYEIAHSAFFGVVCYMAVGVFFTSITLEKPEDLNHPSNVE